VEFSPCEKLALMITELVEIYFRSHIQSSKNWIGDGVREKVVHYSFFAQQIAPLTRYIYMRAIYYEGVQPAAISEPTYGVIMLWN
jgi:hypothetical protein